MTKEELAAKLDGISYPPRFDETLLKEAKKHRLVIVTGGSDDLVEFEGAIYDEAGAPGEIIIDSATLKILEEIDRDDAKVLKKYGVFAEARDKRLGGIKITALWCKEKGYSWTYKTDIPHATFDVWDDPETKYCRGIVFSLDELE